MTIINQTSVTLRVSGNTINPNDRHDFSESCFDTHTIVSDIGSCEITTEYSQRYIHNYGKLVAEEGQSKGSNGLKCIIVRSVD